MNDEGKNIFNKISDNKEICYNIQNILNIKPNGFVPLHLNSSSKKRETQILFLLYKFKG